jgi:glycosyltransferase involved in cell wall biosynthesis
MTFGNASAPCSSSAEEPIPQPPGVFLMSNSFETGGSERQFAALAKSLDRSAFRVSIACIQKKGAFLEELREVGFRDVPEFSLGGSLYKLASWKTRARLARHLRQNAIDIAHAFDFYTNLTLIPAARWARIPVVIASQRQLGDLLTRAQFSAQLIVLRLADAVVCNSQASANGLCRAGLPKHKAIVIANGMPPKVFAPATPAIPRMPGTLRIGMIARMNTRSKNHSSLLRSFARLRNEMPRVELVLAGDGPFRADLEREARHLGIASSVQFLGDRRDIPAIFASVDVSVLPSVSESLSNSIIESMAQGVPAVAARVGGNAELVSEERGILVPPGDEPALASALVRLLKDDALRTTMGAKARSFALANFTVTTMEQRHEDLYRQLLARKNSKRKASRDRQ